MEIGLYLLLALFGFSGLFDGSGGSDDDGITELNGSGGNDNMTGTTGADDMFGDDGDDTLSGRLGDDFLLGGLGNDRLMGGDGDDIIAPGAGQDFVHLGNGNDTLAPYIVTDPNNPDAWISSDFGNDSVHGGPGDDIMVDFRGSNILKGELGNDILIATDFNIDESDTLIGGDGDDTLSGDDGDSLQGGFGQDFYDVNVRSDVHTPMVIEDPDDSTIQTLEIFMSTDPNYLESDLDFEQRSADNPGLTFTSVPDGIMVQVDGRDVVEIEEHSNLDRFEVRIFDQV